MANLFATVTEYLAKDAEEGKAISRKTVKAVWAGFLAAVHVGLKKDRKVRLPDLGILALKYRPAKPKRKGINRFTGKEQMFKAKPASNKLRFRPAKAIKLFAGKLPVVAPKKKK